MSPTQIIAILIVAGLVWTGFWFWIVTAPRRESGGALQVTLFRRVLLPVFLVIGVVAFAASLPALPFPAARATALGPAQMTVNVEAVQWGWIFSQQTLPVGVPIEFVVTSRDVNHGFAIYSPDNQILTQVQAMPNYPNHLIYTFDRPGTYTIRCLEYCGVPHYAMTSALTVR